MRVESVVASPRSTRSLIRLVERGVVLAIVLVVALTAYFQLRDRAGDSVAKGNLAAIVPFVEDYALRQGDYAGLSMDTLAAELGQDASAYVVVDLGPDDFCVESTHAGRTWQVSASSPDPSPGSCEVPLSQLLAARRK